MNAFGPTEDEAAAPLNRVLVTITVMAASIMQSLDNTIANVALPNMQGTMSATQDQMTWVLTSYIIAAAIMTPTTGWLAGQFGRKRLFTIAIAGFTAASILCGAAQTLPEIVLFRLMQGACGAALVPLSQAVLLDINPVERHGRAMSIWGMGVVMGPIVGPMLGGWLTETYNWRWVFYINVPIGVLAFVGILTFMPETTLKRSRFDFFGFAALSLAVGALQLMLDRGELKNWFGSTEIWVEATVAGLAFYLFMVHMFTSRDPFIKLELFKDRNFLVGNVFVFLLGVVLFATLALLPPMMQNLMNYPVLQTGLCIAPRGMGTLVGMLIVGRLIGKVDVRLLIGTGLVLAAIASEQMAHFSLQMDQTPVIWSGLIQGLGTGIAYVSLTTLAFATIPSNIRNEGTAMFNLMRNIGSSLGISVVQTLLTRNTQVGHSTLAARISPYGLAMHHPRMAEQLGSVAGMRTLNDEITAKAGMMAYSDDFRLMTIITVLVIPLLFIARRAQSPDDESAPVMVE